MQINPSPWTEDRIERLKKCFHAGLTCSQIGREIGVTRNSIIGKLHRLGLSRPRQIVQKKAKLPREHRSTIRFTPKPILARVYEAVERSPKNKTLLELEPGECKWPIGHEAPYVFCAHEAVQGPYCAYHWRLGHTYVQGRNDNRAYAIARNNRPAVMTLAISKDREDGAAA